MKRKSDDVDDVAVVNDGKRCRLGVADEVFPSVQLVDYSFSEDEADDIEFPLDELVTSVATSFKENAQGKQLSRGRRSLTASQLRPTTAVLGQRLDKTISAERKSEAKHCSCVFCLTFNDERLSNPVSREQMFYESLKNLHASLNKSADNKPPSDLNTFVSQTVTYITNRRNVQETSSAKGDNQSGISGSTDSETKELLLCTASMLSGRIPKPTGQTKRVSKVVKFGTNFIRWIRNHKQNKKLRVKKTQL